MVLGPFGKRALLYVHFPFRWMTTHKTAARRAQVPARSLIQGMCVPACQHLQRQFCGESPHLAEAKWQPDGKNEDRWVMWGTPTRITEMIYRRQMCCDNQDESTMLRFHCLVAAQLAWMTLLSLIPLKWCPWTQLILTLTLWKTVALSDLTTTSHPAMQQPQTDNRIFPQNFPKPDTGCVIVSFNWTGFQAEHSASWLCALTYRLMCTCARRTIWEDLIWFILLAFKNILIHVATSLIFRRNCIQGKCNVSSFCPTRCGWNLKLVGQQQVILRGVEGWIPVVEAIWCFLSLSMFLK